MFGALGLNLTLGGVRAISEKVHASLITVMPLVNDLLIVVQVAVGIATLVYMTIKIRRVLQKKK